MAIAADLEARGVPFDYEKLKVTYTVERSYLTDFGVGKVFIEAKGYFSSEDRSKLLAVKKANPDLDLRLLFMRASNKLNKDSETTYGQWADKHGFLWAEGRIPANWLKDASRKERRRSQGSPRTSSADARQANASRVPHVTLVRSR